MSNPQSAPLSVVHVVDSLEFGGLERLVLDLSRRQRAAGYRVSVFSILKTAGYLQEVLDAGIAVTQGGKSRSFDLGVLRRLRAASRGADVVHAHNFRPNYYAAMALVGAGRRAPTLVGTCHDMGDRLADRRLRWYYQWALGRTVRLAMVSESVAEQYRSRGLVNPERATTIINGVPVERFANSPQRRADARAALGLGDTQLVIGNVARHIPAKNQRLLISVVPELIRSFPDLKLVLVGYGELEGALRQQVIDLGVEAHVILTGRRSDVADLLSAFDVYCTPSLTEGLPIALLEACAASLAVVATTVGGNAEVIRHEETGLLVAPGDANALGKALDRLLRDAPLRHRVAEAACTWVREYASMELLFSTYEDFYRRAMRERRN